MSETEERQAPVVIVDQSRVTRLIVEIALRREGVLCTGFPDGLAVLRALEDPRRASQVKVVILDLKLPEVDGYALTRLLRVSPQLDHVAIVIFTAEKSLVSRLRARLAGATCYLTKPFKQSTFLSAILPYTRQHERPTDQETPDLDSRGDEYHDANAMRAGPATRKRYAS